MKLSAKFIHNLFRSKAEREKEKEDSVRRARLIKDIENVTSRLSQIQETYNYISESELVDAAIYEELSLKARYAYLLRTAKQENLSCRVVISDDRS